MPRVPVPCLALAPLLLALPAAAREGLPPACTRASELTCVHVAVGAGAAGVLEAGGAGVGPAALARITLGLGPVQVGVHGLFALDLLRSRERASLGLVLRSSLARLGAGRLVGELHAGAGGLREGDAVLQPGGGLGLAYEAPTVPGSAFWLGAGLAGVWLDGPVLLPHLGVGYSFGL